VRGVRDFVDEFIPHTRGGGLPSALSYALRGSPVYAVQMARHSPWLTSRPSKTRASFGASRIIRPGFECTARELDPEPGGSCSSLPRPSKPTSVRCAIFTRKSTEEGLGSRCVTAAHRGAGDVAGATPALAGTRERSVVTLRKIPQHRSCSRLSPPKGRVDKDSDQRADAPTWGVVGYPGWSTATSRL